MVIYYVVGVLVLAVLGLSLALALRPSGSPASAAPEPTQQPPTMPNLPPPPLTVPSTSRPAPDLPPPAPDLPRPAENSIVVTSFAPTMSDSNWTTPSKDPLEETAMWSEVALRERQKERKNIRDRDWSDELAVQDWRWPSERDDEPRREARGIPTIWYQKRVEGQQSNDELQRRVEDLSRYMGRQDEAAEARARSYWNM